MQNSKNSEVERKRRPACCRSRPTALANLLTFTWIGKRWRPFVLPLLLVVAATLALAIDCPLAHWCVDKNCPRLLRRLCGVAEPFGNGLGVMVIALGIYVLDPARRGKLARVLAMSLGAGMAANGVKLLVARVRPRYFDFSGTLQDTFGRWLPLGAGGSAQQSFPSAHAATAIGLAIALGWLYPRGRWLFAALAVLVACQRMEGGNHYLSDTLVGAAIGWAVAMPFLGNAWLASRFDRLEGGLLGQRQWASDLLHPAPTAPLTYQASADEDRSRAA
jgi:membrane-associated phospholipid phosphatase